MIGITLGYLFRHTAGIIMDDTTVRIFDKNHRVAIGKWFEDAVLNYFDMPISNIELDVDTNTLRVMLK